MLTVTRAVSESICNIVGGESAIFEAAANTELGPWVHFV